MSLLIFAGCSPSPDELHWTFSGSTMGTTYHVKAVAPPSINISEENLARQIDRSLSEFNQIMSTYIADSELSQLNRAEVGKWHEISEPLLDVLSLSQSVSEASNGAFDVTVGPLVNVWGFGPQKREGVPSEEVVQNTLQRVGFHNIQLDVSLSRLQKLKDVYIDLSAVAKGYGADVIGELFEQHGILDYMVEIGGEVKIRGRNFAGETWTIGVEKPSLAHTGSVMKIAGDNVGIATSGDYRNFYEVDGQRISHTLDPKTGKPITHSLASITVITDSAGAADAYATAINVLGPELGYDLAVEQKLAAFFVIREGENFITQHTEEFKQYIIP